VQIAGESLEGGWKATEEENKCRGFVELAGKGKRKRRRGETHTFSDEQK